MQYLDFKKLAAIPSREFRDQKPFPWINPSKLLTDTGFERLLAGLPDVSMFHKRFGYTRDHGQKGHDRYSLEYNKNLDIDPAWHTFVKELKSYRYRKFLRKLYGFRPMKLSFHWHYTPSGCAVSPHCDSKVKIGSHIFYLNTDADWKKEWGGETLILDDHGRLDCKSAPPFDAFDNAIAAEAIGNKSLLFQRTARSWHGVRAIDCPEGRLRKVFIVVIERVRPIKTIRNYFRPKKPNDM